MPQKVKVNRREGEIVSFFYQIFGHRIRSGMDSNRARKEASDAVSLRYGVGEGRLSNIITSVRNGIQSGSMGGFRADATQLISELADANQELELAIARNNRLIALLKECMDET